MRAIGQCVMLAKLVAYARRGRCAGRACSFRQAADLEAPFQAETLVPPRRRIARLALRWSWSMSWPQTSALPVSLPFLVDHAYETVDLMGEDFWPYGLESNRHTLETFARYMQEQGLTPERLSVDALFPESTHRTFRI